MAIKKKSAKSIKTRLVSNFIVIILISVIAFETILVYFTQYYFYNNAENALTNQIKISSEFYSKYFSNVPLEENIIDNVDVFWKQTDAQVQIVDITGKILLDSVGIEHKEILKSSDFNDALSGGKGIWIGKAEHADDKVMVVSYPLKSDQEVVGVLRFISSLTEVDKVLRNIMLIFISIGVIVIVIAGAISLLLANSIIHPLQKVTDGAELMASGNLKIRVKKQQNDEIGRLASTLNYMAQEIENREKIKDDFISLVSHELRTPLTSIKGWAITLKNVDPNDKKIFDDGLTIIEKESDRLTGMVEELLDFSNYVSGNFTLHKEKTDLREVFDFIDKHMSQRAVREGIQFYVFCEELPLLEIDKDRMKQVLINLLANAFRFTPVQGTVTLKAYEERDSITIIVKDTGCGIKEEDLSRVKEKFYKGNHSGSQTGLGLAICDEIVDMHEGSLTIKSKIDIGTEVIVTLPKGKEKQDEKR